ncbi:hypothetical protein RIF29_04414 [Crotalaria pallida]|uniref:Protein kinase domain-containing protein n=1 Tax=Crotalaria pallida TaxID=3830 RepID=A0AAN9J169_CROPI
MLFEQECARGIGVYAKFGGQNFKSIVDVAFFKLYSLIEHGRSVKGEESGDSAMITDMAVSALGNICLNSKAGSREENGLSSRVSSSSTSVLLTPRSEDEILQSTNLNLDDDHRILVYEFLAKGSLDNHLFRRSYFQPLSWTIRMKIALDAAKGLAFLHSDEVDVIYRDFITSNVLLDSVGEVGSSSVQTSNHSSSSSGSTKQHRTRFNGGGTSTPTPFASPLHT